MEQENTNREGRFARLVAGLSKTRAQMAEGLAEVFSSEVIDDDFFDDLEEVLIESDMGPQTAVDIVDQLRLKVRVHSILKTKQARKVLTDLIMERVQGHEADYDYLTRKSEDDDDRQDRGFGPAGGIKRPDCRR